MAMIAPFFLAGLVLLALPLLIHRIRRPEREPLRFSSLMFVPDIQKKVIERRKIQDIFLMLLRMAALALLAAVFCRPYFTVQEPESPISENAVSRHLIMIDNSASMTPSRLKRAKELANNVLDTIPNGEDVGVAVFNSDAEMLAPIRSKSTAAKDALQEIVGSFQATRYPTALLFAENQLLTDAEEQPAMTVHMISDFHRSGIPEQAGGWRLSGLISLKQYPVEGSLDNLSLTDVGVRALSEGQLIAGKVKNHTTLDRDNVAVRLFVNGQMIEEKHLAVRSGNASRIEFSLNEKGRFSGWLELEDDDASVDNRRYFVWRPPRKPKVLIVEDMKSGSPYPASGLMAMALDNHWSLKTTQHPALIQEMGLFKPDLLLLASLQGFDEDIGRSLLAWVNEGGKMLLTLGQVPPEAPLNRTFLNPLGIRNDGARYTQSLDQRFVMMTDINFNHPIFQTFANARFNDFSSLHFYNFNQLAITGNQPTAPVKFYGETRFPAMIETSSGKGRVLIWAFSPQLEWTNLPKHIKFVPLLQETVLYLNGRERVSQSGLVGDLYDPSRWDGVQAVRGPGGFEQDGAQSFVLTEPGLISLKMNDQWQPADPVNPDPREMEPTLISPDEFALKLASVSDEGPGFQSSQFTSDSRDKKMEFGYVFLILLVLALLLETWAQEYAAKRKKALQI